MARTPARQPKPPAGRPLHQHLARNTAQGSLVTVAVTLLIAALVSSRANAHLLSAAALALVVAGAAASGVLIGWSNGLYNGAFDVIRGETVLDCAPGCRAEPEIDPWQPRELWKTTLTWALLVSIWAASGAALVAVALNGKRARLLVVFVALAGLAGVASLVVDAIARHRGAHATRTLRAQPAERVGMRRRAWKQIALPIGLSQLLVNAGFAWVLFHDYVSPAKAAGGATSGAKVLSQSVALADVAVIVTLVAAIFGSVAGRWGSTDVLLDRVELDDPEAQTVAPKSLVGVQGLVYIALLGLILAKVVTWLLPTSPNLLEVALARGLFAGVLAFVAAGAGYVRGAVNRQATPLAIPPAVATDTALSDPVLEVAP
jgi:hypothetical protein